MKIAILINYKSVGKKAEGKKHFAAGSVEHEPFNSITELGNIITSVAEAPKECISIGTFEGDGKVTFKDDDHYSRRAKDMLPGNILVIDNDTEQPYDVDIFAKHWDTFKGAGYVRSKSGSTLAGTKENGSHTYFMYEGNDLKKAMLFLEAICICEGYYVVDFYKTGRAVIKTPIDTKLNEVQMPVYEDDVDPVIVEGNAVNINEYPDNYDYLMEKAQRIKDKELDAAQDESVKRHQVYLEEYQGVTKLSNRELLISLNDYASHEVDENVTLYSDGVAVGNIGDLLLGKIKRNTFADIHEPDYGGGTQKAKFYGSMFRSQAHGGIKYYIKVSYAWYEANKDMLVYDVSVKQKEITDMCYSSMTDEEIAEVIDQTSGAVEKSNLIKHIKEVTGLTKEEIREAYNRTLVQDENSLSKYFKGASIFWDGDLGVFVEYHKRGKIRLHKKGNFDQTLMSVSGLEHKDIKTILPQIPLKYMEYIPTSDHNSGPDHINVWQGMKFSSTKDITRIPPTINKLLRNLFIDDFEAKEVFINWMATILQTGIRTGVAWGFFGEQGTGKGLICDIFRDLVGRRNTSFNVSDTQLQSSFNGYAKNVQFIHLNEVASDFHGRHGVAGKLKALITDEYLQINEKGINEVEVQNFANIILNSNKPNPIELDVGDRRWNMIKTPKPLVKCKWFNKDAVDKIKKEIKDFGVYLMQYDIDQFKATQPMELSLSKKSISDQTTSPYKLLGDAVKNKDFEALCDILDPEAQLSSISVEELEECTRTNFWSSDLFKRMYSYISGKNEFGGKLPANHLIKPYITNNPSKTSKINGAIIRGYEI